MKIRKDRKIRSNSYSYANNTFLISSIINCVAAITDFVVGFLTDKLLLIVGGICFSIAAILHLLNYLSSRR